MKVPKKLEKEGAALAIKKKSRGLQVGAGNSHEPALRPFEWLFTLPYNYLNASSSP